MKRFRTLSSQAAGIPKMPKVNAACMIIGDEVLNGKIVDTNSRFFAKYCWENGISLREIITVGDDERQIIDGLRNLIKKYQLIVTSGGIGPTHDDITYESIAKSFQLPVRLDPELKKRMQRLSDPESRLNEQALHDFYRMGTVPFGPQVRNYYVDDKLWVPICSVDHKVYILPGIPQLFKKMLQNFSSKFREIYGLEPESENSYIRFFIKTPFSESQISYCLRKFQAEAAQVSEDIKIGSYPHFGMGFNTISILGSKANESYLKRLSEEILNELDGEHLTAEAEEKYSSHQN